LFVGARLRAMDAWHCPTVARKRPPTKARAAGVFCGSALARDRCWALPDSRPQAASHKSKSGPCFLWERARARRVLGIAGQSPASGLLARASAVSRWLWERACATSAGHRPTVARKRPPTRAGKAACFLWERACARWVLGIAQQSPAGGLPQEQARLRDFRQLSCWRVAGVRSAGCRRGG